MNHPQNAFGSRCSTSKSQFRPEFCLMRLCVFPGTVYTTFAMSLTLSTTLSDPAALSWSLTISSVKFLRESTFFCAGDPCPFSYTVITWLGICVIFVPQSSLMESTQAQSRSSKSCLDSSIEKRALSSCALSRRCLISGLFKSLRISDIGISILPV